MRLEEAATHDQKASLSAASVVKVNLPLVSCCLATYGRPPERQYLVEEAIESFLRQTYPKKELIILNDCPGQEIVCDVPGVQVINESKRYPTLGEKRNAVVAYSTGELLAVWDDDDISLPWRLSLSVEKLGDANYFCPYHSWYMETRYLSTDVHTALTRAHSVYRRDAFQAIGGYPSINFRVDVVLEDRFRELGLVENEPIPSTADAIRSEVDYIYRRGVSPVHISGQHKDGMYIEIGRMDVRPGRYVLQPHWRADYEALVKSIWDGPPLGDPNRPNPHKSPDLIVETPRFLSILHTDQASAELAPVGAGTAEIKANTTILTGGASRDPRTASENLTDPLPLVSCILPTFGRPPNHLHLLEEAVESFLRQTYSRKELLIVNDSPEQILECDAPGVQVINLSERYLSLGEKRNASVRMSQGEIIAMWDDDDICLPWRLSYSIEQMGLLEYFNSQYAWYMDRKHLYPDVKVLPAGSLSVFKREAFEAVGGFPSISFGDDQVFEDALRSRYRPEGYPAPHASKANRSEIYYIYRWGVSPVHISGGNVDGMYEKIGQRPISPGTFTIVPHWRMDYEAAVKTFWEKPDPGDRRPPIPADTTKFISILGSKAFTESRNSDDALAIQAVTTATTSPEAVIDRDDLPLVSCILPTYGRPSSHQHLLEEAIESFLRQTYPNKELIILNDCPEQELVCDLPGVRVVNLSERFPTLGEKRHAGILMSSGSVIAPWDDDDISLPWRLSLSVERLGNTMYFNPARSWFMDSKGLHSNVTGPVGNTLGVFTRAAYDAAGGYPKITFGEDMALDGALRKVERDAGIQPNPPVNRDETFYIIRWGVSPVHISGRGKEGMYDDIGSRPVEPGRFVLQPHWRADYTAAVAELIQSDNQAHDATSDNPAPRYVPVITNARLSNRRAITCFVEDRPHLIQQMQALRLSWLSAETSDTDLVVFGPQQALDQLPDDLVKIEQTPAADDPIWKGFRRINSIAYLNREGAQQLDRYTNILRTDADTFITPAWNAFRPDAATFGRGSYCNDENIKLKIAALAISYGLSHNGLSNVGSTWYGPPDELARIAAMAEMLTRHLLSRDFEKEHGQWPGWYRGVAHRYASEIAVNHLTPHARVTDLLDAYSTTSLPVADVPHIHCWHTPEHFSKHRFMGGGYSDSTVDQLDLRIVRDYCLAMSIRSLSLQMEEADFTPA